MGPKNDNKKSAKSTNKSVKPKGKNAKNTSDTKETVKPQETPKEKAIQKKINFPVTPTKPEEKVKPQETVKPKEKAIKKTQKKINFPVTSKTTSTTNPTASTSF